MSPDPYPLRLFALVVDFMYLRFSQIPWVAIVLVRLIVGAFGQENGVYLLKEGAKNSTITFPGGGKAELDRRLGDSEYSLKVISTSNWNDQFEIRLADRTSIETLHYFALVVDGQVICEKGGTHVFANVAETLAGKIAALKGSHPVLRKDLGHRLIFRIAPLKPNYSKDQPIKIAVQAKNVGTVPMLIHGEMPSDSLTSSQLWMIPQKADSEKCKDIRNPNTQTTVFRPREWLQPNQSITLKVEDLRRWFSLRAGERYFFVAAYKLEIFEKEDDADPVWIDYVADEFVIDCNKD
jgi:hypothetical protein